eukprot:jgi/Mesvir1/26596/Mv09567-RA.1
MGPRQVLTVLACLLASYFCAYNLIMAYRHSHARHSWHQLDGLHGAESWGGSASLAGSPSVENQAADVGSWSIPAAGIHSGCSSVIMPNTELWGPVVKHGVGHLADSPEDCCEKCALFNQGGGTCDGWVFCHDVIRCEEHFRECWLKLVEDHNNPAIARKGGEEVQWTSGLMLRDHQGTSKQPAGGDTSSLAQQRAAAHVQHEAQERRSIASQAGGVSGGDTPFGIHTVCTSNGSPYLNFQTRIMYASYLRVARDSPHMAHFTRVLHRSKPDALMGEVPTARFDPWHPACDVWCDFPVHDRPRAVAEWLRTPGALKGQYILMIETDYVFIKPVPLPAPGARSLVYSYDYINPEYPGLGPIMTRLAGGALNAPIAEIPHSGPAPVLMTPSELRSVAPWWVNMTERIEADVDARHKLGWVREMYAFSLGVAIARVPVEQQHRLQTILIAQPPADPSMGSACMYHYTWGTELSLENGTQVWAFDKRKYTTAEESFKVPRVPMPPPMSMQGSLYQQFPSRRLVSEEMLATLHHFIGLMNEAIDTLGPIKGCGWAPYPDC